jgi:hypothetical protein
MQNTEPSNCKPCPKLFANKMKDNKMGDMYVTCGTEMNRGVVEKPEERILLEDIARMTQNFILKE